MLKNIAIELAYISISIFDDFQLFNYFCAKCLKIRKKNTRHWRQYIHVITLIILAMDIYVRLKLLNHVYCDMM